MNYTASTKAAVGFGLKQHALTWASPTLVVDLHLACIFMRTIVHFFTGRIAYYLDFTIHLTFRGGFCVGTHLKVQLIQIIILVDEMVVDLL